MFVAHTAALKITAKPSFPAVRTDNNKSGCLRTKKKKKEMQSCISLRDLWNILFLSGMLMENRGRCYQEEREIWKSRGERGKE